MRKANKGSERFQREQLRIPSGIGPGVRKESASSVSMLHPSQKLVESNEQRMPITF